MFHRAYFFAAPVHIFSRRLVADELLASDRVLAFGEPLEMFLLRPLRALPILGEPSVPLAAYPVAFGVVVLAGVAELFRMIRRA